MLMVIDHRGLAVDLVGREEQDDHPEGDQ